MLLKALDLHTIVFDLQFDGPIEGLTGVRSSLQYLCWSDISQQLSFLWNMIC